MHVIKRELLLCLTISALVFTSALAWGSPFTTFAAPAQTVAVSANSQQQMPSHSQPQRQMQQQQTAKTFTGTVVKSGSSYALQSTSGETYKLTGAPNAASYVGKTVTVKGRLNNQTKSIEVSSIRPD